MDRILLLLLLFGLTNWIDAFSIYNHRHLVENEHHPPDSLPFSLANEPAIKRMELAEKMPAEFRSNEPNMFNMMDPFVKLKPNNFNNVYLNEKFASNYNPALNMALLNEQSQPQQLQQLNLDVNTNQDDTLNDMLGTALKKYDIKRVLLKKILGNSMDLDEDEGGFFSNKHLRRHGTAGMAAKVLGELIGIKIRESIETIGKSFSEYAKDFTARNFVNLGQLFSRVFTRIKK